ncbi:MAG: xylose isomerase [Actinobacteria bacterium HGW-Actinobacteria-4]|nr:MAG: xylose isomerase [Actinobacteria bacterium HGW-Actinobacteria-4]
MDLSVFDRDNLAAWCFVPYDSVERNPVQRAEMLNRLGLTKAVWDWRPEHVPAYGAHLEAFAQHGIELTGLWAPHVLPTEGDGGEGTIQPDLRELIEESAARDLKPQLWACLEFGPPGPANPLAAQTQRAMVDRVADHLAPLAELARAHGMTVALYNHLGWFGEPANQLAVLEHLAKGGLANIGLAYQQHHGHAHTAQFKSLLATMAPHLVALGLNGMVRDPAGGTRKIHPLGHGELDLGLARIIAESGWHGTVTVLCHTMDDAEQRLLDNLEGLAWMVDTLSAESTDPSGEPVPTGPPAPRIPEPVWPH